MAFLVVNPAPIKTISLLLLTFLIWHGGTSANVIPAVTSFTATETRETPGSSVLLTWSIPTNVNASRYTYDIEVSTNTASVRNVTNINGNNTTVNNLNHGVNYTFKIYTNDSGSFSSASSTSITTQPSPAINLNIVSRTTTSLTLSWVAPNDINASTYSYLIIVSNGSNTWNITTVQNVLTRQVIDLSPGVNYNFTVYTLTSDSVLSTASLTINGTTNPSPVTNLNIVSRTTTSLTLSWGAPNNINTATYSYLIIVSNGSNTWNITTVQNALTHQVNGLLPGVNYNFTVYTLTLDSVLSTAFLTINGTTNPSPVTNLNIVSRTTTSLTLSWGAPNNINTATYSYLIIVSNGSNTWNITTAQNALTHQVNGLSPGVNYNFTVYTLTLDSVLSTAFLTINGTTNPSPVTILNIVSRTTASLNLSWGAPNDINTATYSYLIIVSNGSNTWNITTGQNALTHQVNGLLPGVNYNFTVYTLTLDSVLSTAFLTINGTTNPSPGTILNIVSSTTASLNLSWVAPNDINKSSYSYLIIVSNGSNTWNITTAQNALTHQVNGLLPGVNYNFTVYTRTSDSVLSTASLTINGTTNPSPGTILNIVSSTTASLNLSWVAPNNLNTATYSYLIIVSNGSNTWNITTARNALTHQVNGLSPGVNYNFTVYTLTSDSVLSTAFLTINGTTNPSPGTILNIVSSTTTSLNLSWVAPNNLNTATYSYLIIVSNGSNTWNITTAQNALTHQVIGLSPGVNYKFTVYTRTLDSVLSTAFLTISGTTNPSPVTNLNIVSSTTTSLTLSWVAPSDINPSTYSYLIIVSNGSNTWNITTVQNVETRVVDGLLPGVNYNFTVYTRTSDSVLSTASLSINGTTNPSPVTILNIVSSTTASLNLSWVAPNNINTATYSYLIIVSNGSNTWNITTAQNALTHQVNGLSPGVNYNFTVYTRTSDSVLSTAFLSINGTTNPFPINNLRISSTTTTTLTLSWEAPNDINKATYIYVITVSNSSHTWNINTLQNANSNEIPNLLPGVKYSFTVHTQTINGVQSTESLSLNGTTNPSPVNSITLVNRSNSSITIMWTTPSDVRVKEYEYNVFYTATKIVTLNNIYTAPGLQPGSRYVFNVTSEIDGMTSVISTFTVYSVPNQPGNLGGGSVNTSSINVSWQAPNDPNANSYEYNVTWIEGVSQNTTGNDNTYNTSMVIQGLQAGYQYGVIIHSMIGGASSEPSTIYLLTDPNIIKSPEIGNITNSSVIFRWTWPESGVTGMEIKSTTANAATIEIITDRSITEYEMTNLTPGNFYEFTLRSYKNSDNDVLSSGRIHRREAAPTERTTYSEPVTRTIQILPAHVTNIQCSKVGGGYAIIVHFICPEGNFTELNVLVNGGTSDALTNCSGSGEVTVRSLQPANGYDVRVQTVAYPLTVLTIIHRCSTDNVGVIVGAIFGVLLFLLLVGLIAFFILRKRRSKKTEMEIPDVKKQRRFRTLSKEQFADYFQQQHANSDFGFAEEYQELGSVGTKQLKREAELPDNRSKNRFTNVLPYDHSRVKLDSTGGNEISDYINANYMPGYNATKEFIASQGPLPNTNADFWRMIWEHRVNTIVMLTNCMENGRTKCEHYWPLDYTPCTYGDITVTVTSETILTEWTIRDFSLKHARQQDVKQVRHFHFTVWPDHGVPENTNDIIQFRSLVREHMDQQKSNGPAVVHCSAGVGRTGTLIALDYLIQQMEKENRISAYGIVEKMRMNRPLMVQTESQYVFLNKCMLSLIEQPEEENIYENQGSDLIYENANVIRNCQNDRV